MKHLFLGLMMLAPAAAMAADDKAAAIGNEIFVYVVIGLAVLGLIIALSAFKTALADTHWNLADALSEEVEISDPANPTQKVTKMVASTSRLIAFIGLLGIFFLYVGFGVFLLFDFGTSQTIPDTEKVTKFLLSGLTLFAPYLVNKFAGLFGK
jgi:hypothetical protein